MVTGILAIAFDVVDVGLEGFDNDRWPIAAGALLVVTYLSIQLVKQREQSALRAREAEAARGQLQRFLAMISHDLRAPLTVVDGYAQLMERQLATDNFDALRRSIASVREGTHRINRLVEDLLVAARLGEGRFEIHPDAMDLAECLRKVAAEQQTQATQPLIVNGPDHMRGVWDRERLSQVLTNLVSNAIKYSPPTAPVTLRLTGKGRWIQIEVTDRGDGIAPDQIDKLFQPFTRLDNAPTVDGTGLGLYIARGIVQSHGGLIRVESQIGRGTTFIVRLPWVQEPQAAPEPLAKTVDVASR
jgi:signal transduction histidine kinase